jgi:hypothetical protein
MDMRLRHAITRKRAFDKRVLKSPGKVTFDRGQLVQVYRSDLVYTFKTERKLLPKWSQPYRVKRRIQNAYELERLDGTLIEGEFSVRQLRAFTPKPGSQLEKQQEWYESNEDRYGAE